MTVTTDRPKVGDRIRFYGERQSYVVQAISSSGRYAACTKPFNARKTYLYTVVDFVDQVRGVDDSIGNCLGYGTPERCAEALALFESGEFEFSHRRRPIPLEIERIWTPKDAMIDGGQRRS